MKALIFDFDGTIADSFLLSSEIFHEITRRQARQAAEEIRSLRGQTTRELLKQLNIHWYQLPYMVYQWRKRMSARVGEVKPFAGIGPILHELHARSYRLFVVSSNTTETIETFLKNHQMINFFSGIYGNAAVFKKVKTLRKIMHEHQLTAADCMYIGDEVRDIQAAQQAGMAVTAATWGYNTEPALLAAKPQHIARRPEDLLTINA